MANPVRVNASATTPGINATITTRLNPLDRALNEYECNEPLASPVSEGGGTLPGAIEPGPVNKQFEEEFWAHPPWQKQPPGAAPGAGVVIAARTARTRRGDALVRIDCAGSAPCGGELKLAAKLAAPRKHGASTRQ